MNTFLKTVAHDLYAYLDGNFERVSVVFPNKRASLFFERHILEQMGQHLWAPTYHTLDDIFSHLSQKTVGDSILLNCMLYRAHCEVWADLNPDQEVRHESLDRFYPWGEVMLADFNDIDNNMANAEKVLANVKDLEDLKTFDYFSEAQLQAISTYFEHYDVENQTLLKKKFQNIWSTLHPTYLKFRAMLAAQQYAYSGMLKREVVEYLETQAEAPAWLANRTFVFVGFNVLNETERRLFIQLRRLTKVLFYWDYDLGYLNAHNETVYEAGRFIRDNLTAFPNKLDNPTVPFSDDVYRGLAKPKRIRLVETSTETQQARLAGQELQRTWQHDEALNETAIVLCNEAVLQPMLHSLPSQYKLETPNQEVQCLSMPVNITMGYPLSDTPVVSFLVKLMEMQLYGRLAKGWRYRYVQDVLMHPYAKYLMGDEAMTFRQSIVAESKYIISDQDPHVQANPEVFTPCTTHAECLNYLAHLTQKVGLALRQSQTDDFLSQLYAESVFEAYKLINRLVGLVAQTSSDGRPWLDVQGHLLLRLLNMLLRQRAVPFHGEPAEGVQLLGLLETRNIDFKRVVLLSANEGVLPAKNQRASFIPYALREVHGMTTHERQISLAAYYFYRLISRADDITILYNGSTEGMQTGEMSRFVSQLLVAYAPGEQRQSLLSPHTTIERWQLDARSSVKTKQPFEVHKSEAVMQRLLKRYDLLTTPNPTDPTADAPHVSYLSPSALSTYMNCPMQFYFKYVAELFEDDELTEEFDNRIFGLVFHGTMEMLYKPFMERGVDIQSTQLTDMANDARLLRKTVDMAFAREYFKVPKHKLADFEPHYSGEQLITRTVIIEYVKKQLRYDALCCPIKILGLETKAHEYQLSVDIPNHPSILVRLGGIIDRLDYAMLAQYRDQNGQLVRDSNQRFVRVVDYKTSSSAQTTKTIDALFDVQEKKRAAYIFQTLYYCYVLAMCGQFANAAIKPFLMYVKLASETRNLDIKIDKDVVNDFAHQSIAGAPLMDTFADKMTNLVREIFDPALPFTQTTNESDCKYCPFKEMCGRRDVG